MDCDQQDLHPKQGFSLLSLEGGGFRLGICIPDVYDYLKDSNKTLEEARARV